MASQTGRWLTELEKILDQYRCLYFSDFYYYVKSALKTDLKENVEKQQQINSRIKDLFLQLYKQGLFDYNDNLIIGGYRGNLKTHVFRPLYVDRLCLYFQTFLRSFIPFKKIKWIRPAISSFHERFIFIFKDMINSITAIETNTSDQIERSYRILTASKRLEHYALTHPINDLILGIEDIKSIYIFASFDGFKQIKSRLKDCTFLISSKDLAAVMVGSTNGINGFKVFNLLQGVNDGQQ